MAVRSQGRYLKGDCPCTMHLYQLPKVGPSEHNFRRDQKKPARIPVRTHVSAGTSTRPGTWNLAGGGCVGRRQRAKDQVSVIGVPTHTDKARNKFNLLPFIVPHLEMAESKERSICLLRLCRSKTSDTRTVASGQEGLPWPLGLSAPQSFTEYLGRAGEKARTLGPFGPVLTRCRLVGHDEETSPQLNF